MEGLDLIHGGSAAAGHPLLHASGGADPMLSAAYNAAADGPLSPPFGAPFSNFCGSRLGSTAAAAGASEPDEDALYEVRYPSDVLSPSVVRTIRYAADYGGDTTPGSGNSQLYDSCHFLFGDETTDSLYASPCSSSAASSSTSIYARLSHRTGVGAIGADNDATTALLSPSMLLDPGASAETPMAPPDEEHERANSAELPSSASSGGNSSHFAFIGSNGAVYNSNGTLLAKRAKFSTPTTTTTASYDSYASMNTGLICCYETETVPTVRVITKYKNQLPPLSSCLSGPSYGKNGESSTGFKYSNRSSSSTDDFYDTTSSVTDGTVGSSKCSTPSSISSTINSVVVKSLSYATSSSDAYNTYASSTYTPLTARPMNIIVNDMSGHQQPNSIQPPLLSNSQFDIKVEQQPKFDYAGDYAPYTLVAASPYHSHVHHGSYHHTSSGGPMVGPAIGDACGGELDELNTLDLAQRISQELKRYSIPQAIFAQRVLCRSQGTLSDLLRNPKPWSKLKSGRETFRRMAKWLQEPEFQRMSSLRIAACKRKEEQTISGVGIQPVLSAASLVAGNGCATASQVDASVGEFAEPSPRPSLPPSEYSGDGHPLDDDQDSPQPQQSKSVTAKKPRLVFTDIQRRTLYAIFKETKRPSREMQITISQQLGLDPNTVANFFMNARRRDHAQIDGESDSSAGIMPMVGGSGRTSLPGTPPFSSSGSGSCSGSISPTPTMASAQMMLDSVETSLPATV